MAQVQAPDQNEHFTENLSDDYFADERTRCAAAMLNTIINQRIRSIDAAEQGRDFPMRAAG